MYDQCLIAEYESVEKARIGLEVLERNGFTIDTVSAVSRQNDASLEQLADLEREAPPEMPDESPTGLGMLIGGGVAAPIAAFTMVGPVMLAGPIAGIAAGAAVAGALGHADKWGVHEDARAAYEKRVQEGAVLVIVNDEPIRLQEAEDVLATTNPRTLDRFAHPQ